MTLLIFITVVKEMNDVFAGRAVSAFGGLGGEGSFQNSLEWEATNHAQ